MPDFDIDAALVAEYDPWKSYGNLVAAATGRSEPYSPHNPTEVFFYPNGGGDDWEPLVKFPSCKTFIYCDLALHENHGNKPLAEMAKTICARHRELEYVNTCQHSWEGDDFHCQMLAWEKNAALYLKSLWPPPAGEPSFAETVKQIVRNYRPDRLQKRRTWVARFMRKITGRPADMITMLFLTVEGLSAYLNLFFANGIAPGVICLKPYAGGSRGQFTPTMMKAFGVVLKNDHAAHNSLLVVSPERKGSSPWMSDWKHPHRSFTKWGQKAYSTSPISTGHRSLRPRRQHQAP